MADLLSIEPMHRFASALENIESKSVPFSCFSLISEAFMDFPIVLEEDLFPMQAFFNAMPARSLVSTLKAFCKGVGAGFNDAVCEFPDELGENEERFEGVMFYMFEENLTVSNSEFLGALSKLCSMHVERHPEMSEEVDDLLGRLAARLR